MEFNAAVYDAWWESVTAQRRKLGDITSLQLFFTRCAQTFLTKEEGKNLTCSPLNIYMALSMLAQLTGGESREQILTLLGSDSMDSLRQQAGNVWNSSYRNDGALTSILASSLWLNRDVKFNHDTMDILARDFYSSSYQGEMGSAEFNKVLQSWLSEQTEGILEKQAANIEMEDDTILALAATVCFKAKWHNEFLKEKTESNIFHAPGGDVEAGFMHQTEDQIYYWGDRFACVCQSFEEGGAMWFLLPDEGVAAEELFFDEEAAAFLFTADKYDWEKQKYLFVNKSIPKFDVSSQMDLRDGLKAMGITDIFDPGSSDFTPMTNEADVPVVLSKADHAARVMIDEEGCTAAAFTVMDAAGAAMPPDDEIDFVLNRPFIFCITGENGLPMFVGIVNYPAAG
ncbi:MAG: serpin family protein [Lachnospiraceae bacterium]|nr:serpin family protein [Lachnospiraceae bacterium]